MYCVVVYGVCFLDVLLLLVCECLWVVGSMCLFVLFVIVWYCMFYVCYRVCGCVLYLYTCVNSCLCAFVTCCVILYGMCVLCFCFVCACAVFNIYVWHVRDLLCEVASCGGCALFVWL